MNGETILMAGGGTGGHVFPMIAVADAVRVLAPSVRLVFVGTERGLETKIVPERGYELELVSVLPIRGGGPRGALRGIARAAASLPQARALVKRYAPRAVFSIGGYAAGPVSLAARVAGVPLALMEPNAVMGLANRLVAPIVQRAYTAFPESERHFAAKAVLRSGVPIRSGFSPRPLPARQGPLRVLVLGGSQGAKGINERVPKALATARVPIVVTHQTGASHVDGVERAYRELGAGDRARVVPFIDEVPDALAGSHLVIGRAGASAVSEICAVGRPSILVPFPYASGDHQLRNAESLAADGAAVCLAEADAAPERLAAEIDRLAAPGELESMASRARARGRPEAAATIARDLLVLAGLRASDEVAARASGSPSNPAEGPLELSEVG